MNSNTKVVCYEASLRFRGIQTSSDAQYVFPVGHNQDLNTAYATNLEHLEHLL